MARQRGYPPGLTRGKRLVVQKLHAYSRHSLGHVLEFDVRDRAGKPAPVGPGSGDPARDPERSFDDFSDRERQAGREVNAPA